eukprot:Clim_evm15s253 gene=Clim_evmTU15s253
MGFKISQISCLHVRHKKSKRTLHPSNDGNVRPFEAEREEAETNAATPKPEIKDPGFATEGTPTLGEQKKTGQDSKTDGKVPTRPARKTRGVIDGMDPSLMEPAGANPNVIYNVPENAPRLRKPGSINGQNVAIMNLPKGSSACVVDYIDSASVDDCVDAFVLIGPTRGSVFIRDCTGCTVIAVCGQMRLRDCKNMTVYLHCKTAPVVESSTDITLCPVKLSYDKLDTQMQSAELDRSEDQSHAVYDFTPPADGEPANFVWKDELPSPELPAKLTVLLKHYQLNVKLDRLVRHKWQ